jgi:hypothetical protein
MAEPLINFVTKTLVVQDALKKPEERDKPQKPAIKKKRPDNKDQKRIINTYA